MKPAVLQAAILEILSEHEHPVPERYIMLAFSVEFRIKITFTDLRDALHKLEETKHIIGLHGHDGTILWGISDLGRARRLELI